MSFTRKGVVPPKPPAVSALSAMLKSAGTTTNPFSELYSLISGRGENASSYVQVYFPHAQEPRNKAMGLSVRKDASVEEVIGFALWTYWEEGWKPKLDEGLTEEDEKWNTQLSAIGWILRIAEDDGEVDDDFPRKFLVRILKIILMFFQLRTEWEKSSNSTRMPMPSWKPTLPKVNISFFPLYLFSPSPSCPEPYPPKQDTTTTLSNCRCQEISEPELKLTSSSSQHRPRLWLQPRLFTAFN